MQSYQVVAVILGGGAGSRLYPLTVSRSKPAVPIAGKYRLVDIPISNCINSNISRMFVLTQYNSASLNKHIKNTYQFSGFSTGFVDILAAEQTPDGPGWFQGTADAVRQSLKHINIHEFDYVLVLSGDQLYQMDFAKMIDQHIESEAELTIATIPVNAKEATSFGILKKDQNNNITNFIEKPDASLLPDWISDTGLEMASFGRNYLASMGIYVFNRSTLDRLLKEEYHFATDFGKEIIPGAINSCKVISFQYEGYWEDIGNISSFFEANLALTMEIPPFNLFDGRKMIYTRSRMLPPAKISGTLIEKAIIADGCIVHASEIKNAVIGIRSRIGKDTKINNCYVMGNDFYETLDELAYNKQRNLPMVGIGNNCVLTRVIVDKNCRIGDDVILEGGHHLSDTDHPLYTIKDGIIVIKKGVIIPNGFVLK